MLYSIELSTERRADQLQSRPRPRRLQDDLLFFRGRLRRGGVSVRPIVRSLLRKREVRRLGMGRRSPHQTPSHQEPPPGSRIRQVCVGPRGPPSYAVVRVATNQGLDGAIRFAVIPNSNRTACGKRLVSLFRDRQQREIAVPRPDEVPSCLAEGNRDEAPYFGSSSIVPLSCLRLHTQG
jgi:hypothetical protein